MKPEEIRVGNLVDYNGIISKVSEICSPKPLKDKRYSDKWIIELFDGAGLLTCDIMELKPIILTEEILLKCGFEKDDTGVGIFEQDYHEWYQKELLVIGMLCQSSDKLYLFDENTDTLRVMYLHQLQNLYYCLCGEELKIEL